MIINETIHNGDILRLIVHSVDVQLTSYDDSVGEYRVRDFLLRFTNRDMTFMVPGGFFTAENDGSLTCLISSLPYCWSYPKGGYTYYVYAYTNDGVELDGEHPYDASGIPIEELSFASSAQYAYVTDGENDYPLTTYAIPSTSEFVSGQYDVAIDGGFGSMKCVSAVTINDDYHSHRILDVDVEIVCDAATKQYGLDVAVTDYFVGISQARYYNYKTRITMTQTIVGAAPFQVPTDSFSISQSGQDYTIQCSVDYDWQKGGEGATWEDMTDVTAGDMFMASLVTPGLTYKLSGNTSTVTLKY